MSTREIRSVTAHRSDSAANTTEELRTVKNGNLFGYNFQFSQITPERSIWYVHTYVRTSEIDIRR
jgi:hypothetical protein